jgi:hypothetical protein
MCPKCKSVYEVSFSSGGMILGANVTSKYESLLHPGRHVLKVVGAVLIILLVLAGLGYALGRAR